MKEVGLGVWRVPFPLAEAPDGSVHYRPFVGSQLGLVGGWPMQQLLQAFTWHSLRGTIPRTMDFPGCGERPVNWGVWPNHYFDEWFLAVALYPRFASAGMVTFAPSNLRCTVMLLLDIEYAMWANPNSQMVFVPHENCCPPPADSGNAGHAGEPETAEASENEHRVKLPS